MQCSDCIAGAVTAYLLTLIITWGWIRLLWKALNKMDPKIRPLFLMFHFGKDMNKYERVIVPRFAGIWTVVGILFGFLVLEAYHVYLHDGPYRLSDVLGISMLVILGGFVGLVDDIMGWKTGIAPIYRVIASFMIALPLSVVKAGTSVMILPIIGKVNLGLAYSLLVVPIGVMGASNAFNMLAGYNGLEAGMASIILAGYAVYAFTHGKILAFKLSIIALAGLIAFLAFNWYPARTFPGNAFTYAVGALLAAIVIIDNFEKLGVALFTLYFLELVLFVRGLKNNIYKQTFGKPQKDGSLELPYDKIYSVAHLAILFLKKIRGRATELGVVLTILGWQTIITIVSLLLIG